MSIFVSRLGMAAAIVCLGLSVSACGYNNIPTHEEQAKAKWADVQNNYQRRADLIPNLVATVQGYAKQEKDVLTAVVEARAKATQIKIDVSQLPTPRSSNSSRTHRTSSPARSAGCLRSARTIPISNRTRTSWRCSRSSRAPRTASPWRGATTSRRCGSTTPSSRPSPAYCGQRPFPLQQADGGICGER